MLLFFIMIMVTFRCGGKMKYNIKIVLIVVITFLFSTSNVYARRGCCSWHGGVSGSCRYGKQVCNDGTTSPSCVCEGGYDTTPAIIYGCTDSNSINYNKDANRNDGSCIKKVYGCTDSNAYNYKENANTDDGSCIAKVYGCMDSKANNYNKEANTSDSSCLYTKKVYKYSKIKYKTIKKYSFFKKEGTIIQAGKYGKRKVTLEEVVDENNKVISSKVLKTETIKKSTTKIVSTKKKNNKKSYQK